MNFIDTSVFELFKTGPGPSSSHTIGPMSAAADFLSCLRVLDKDILDAARTVEIDLYGSLSATGKGHGTDRAVLAGLLDQEPQSCSAVFLESMNRDQGVEFRIEVPGHKLRTGWNHVHFQGMNTAFPFSNTLVFRLTGPEGDLWEKEYYSVGGGFVQWKGWMPPEKNPPAHPYSTMTELRNIVRRKRIDLHTAILENEKAITGRTEVEIRDGLDAVVDSMEESVQNGLASGGVLPGPIGLHRKARVLHRRALKLQDTPEGFLVALSAYAFATAEENAAGHRIVTAPTAGSCGVMPALVHMLVHHDRISRRELQRGLLAAAAVGFVAKHNASISGAEVGCQGEIGVAAAMAAAMVAHARGHRIRIVENAAEIALEHHLGLTCDPVFGQVQIPCIERNAMGALKAYTAYLIASAEVSKHHKVDLDQTIRAMAETGRDMSAKYKETSTGGLALSVVQC
ncbi:MAG: L-serine ammonia-lyase [Deltaproteobacteria bacterium]|nr:L-serine ammonia-lyase [Deltaproteobacteria bacterium]